MDLTTTYLGFHLPHPLIVGASPLVDDIDMVRQLEDAGAAAIVMHSLFEEQITLEHRVAELAIEVHRDAFAEALGFLPDPDTFALGPDEYLEQIRRLKEAVDVPVIGSLNGSTNEGWLEYAPLMEQAGADAIELNVYALEVDTQQTAAAVERRTVDMLRTVRSKVNIPVAMKLSPFYTAVAHFAKELDQAGADGLVLFNRFYQPDIDVEQLEVEHCLHLSTSEELLLRLRWLAILSPELGGSLAATGGIHTPIDALKAVMAGAHAVQVVSAILRHGPQELTKLRDGLAEWLDQNAYASLSQARGSMSLARCPNPAAYERANYMRILQGWAKR